MTTHDIASANECLERRKQLLVKEKELTRLRDQISKERRELPWLKLEKNCIFMRPDGEETLSELFAGQSQMMIYHIMYGPEWDEGAPVVLSGPIISMITIFI